MIWKATDPMQERTKVVVEWDLIVEARKTPPAPPAGSRSRGETRIERGSRGIASRVA
jgi:hypothetical protein